MTQTKKLIVLSSVPPPPVAATQEAADIAITTATTTTTASYVLDQLDDFNHPRQRRDIILQALLVQQEQEQIKLLLFKNEKENSDKSNNNQYIEITFDTPSVEITIANKDDMSKLFHNIYSSVHSTSLLTFLESAWSHWVDLGPEGRDPIGCGTTSSTGTSSSSTHSNDPHHYDNIPPLIPACTPLLLRGPTYPAQQRESKHVIGKMSYYCTDTCTPIFYHLTTELYSDTILLQTCLDHIRTEHLPEKEDQHHPGIITRTNQITTATKAVYYIVPHHPGHHAAYDCFGGYCYVNHIAALAQNILHMTHHNNNNNKSDDDDERVVILDVDYHCGNGTAAIAHHIIHQNENNSNNDNIMVISIHCDPDYDYPFHMGFADDSTERVIHIPLLPGTGWETGYRTALLNAIAHIQTFDPTTLLVSLGLDTYDQDPCTIRRAGFTLQSSDYMEMGKLLATISSNTHPNTLRRTIFVQEGGYRMDTIGEAAKDVVVSYTQHA